MARSDSEPSRVIERLCQATNAHDVDAIVACFTPGYRNDTPVHPARSFTGREQVRRNWTQILSAIPDLSARIVASVTAGDTVWSEWEQRGTRTDGSLHQLRGVIVFAVEEDLVAGARFFLEPVDPSTDTVDVAVRGQLSGGAR